MVKIVGNVTCSISDAACCLVLRLLCLYHFVQEVQQAKVHWVSGRGRGPRTQTHTYTHAHMYSPPCPLQWRYNIRLENFTSDRVQLRERHWRIYGSTGTLETVKGRGVIGQVGLGEGHHRAGGLRGGASSGRWA